jgi:hypothetical protein
MLSPWPSYTPAKAKGSPLSLAVGATTCTAQANTAQADAQGTTAADEQLLQHSTVALLSLQKMLYGKQPLTLKTKIAASEHNARAKQQAALPAPISHLHVEAILINLANSTTACVCALLLYCHRRRDCHRCSPNYHPA